MRFANVHMFECLLHFGLKKRDQLSTLILGESEVRRIQLKMDSVGKEVKADLVETRRKDGGTLVDDDSLVDFVRDSGDDDSKLVASSGSHRDRGDDKDDDDLHSYSTSSEECVPDHIRKLYHTTKITRTTSGISEKENAAISSSPTSLNSEEKLQTEWNPMKRDCDTAQNVISSDIDKSAGAFFMGVKHKEKSWAETPCPFYKGEGNYCWKGPMCRMLHKVVDAADLGQERVASSYTLDNKPSLQPGMWVDVKVVYIVSPSEFYVIPRNETECVCRAAFPPETSNTPPLNPMQHDGSLQYVPDTMTEEFGTGVKAFENIKAKLNELLEPNMTWRQRQSTHYALTELVAVKRTEKNGVRSWLRSAILESNVTHVADREIPHHKVQLIDDGRILTLRADEMCSLPLYLGYYPALAYKCCLNGVVPVGNTWLRRASVALLSMLTGKNIKMNVTKSNNTASVCKTMEVDPYLVDVLVPRSNVPQDLTVETSAPIVSVAEVLACNCLALDFNQFPGRPILNSFFDQKILVSPINPKINVDPSQMLVEEFKRLTATEEEDDQDEKSDFDSSSCSESGPSEIGD